MQILNVSRSLTISVELYGEYATIWLQKFHVQEREQTCRCGVNAIGKYQCRSTSAKPADKRSPQRKLQAHQTESRSLKRPNILLN